MDSANLKFLDLRYTNMSLVTTIVAFSVHVLEMQLITTVFI